MLLSTVVLHNPVYSLKVFNYLLENIPMAKTNTLPHGNQLSCSANDLPIEIQIHCLVVIFMSFSNLEDKFRSYGILIG